MRQVARRGVALAALSCSVEESFALFGISHQDVQRVVVRSGSQRIAHLLVQEMGQIHNLILAQRDWLSRRMALRKIRPEGASVAVMKNY